MDLEELRKEWTKKDPERGVLQAKLWDKRAGEYKERPIPTAQEHPFLKQVYEEVEIRPEMKILDIGCGAGRFSLAFAKEGAQATGTDVSPEMIRAARELADREQLENVEFINSDWSDLDVEQVGFSQKFDLVFAHMTPAVSDYDTLEKMCACAKKDCYLVKPSRRKDMVLDAAFEAAGISGNREETDTSVARIFSYLWMKGYEPYLGYRDEIWEHSRTIEDMLAWCTDRAELQGKVTSEQKEKMKECLLQYSENGKISERITTTIVTIHWCVKEENYEK